MFSFPIGRKHQAIEVLKHLVLGFRWGIPACCVLEFCYDHWRGINCIGIYRGCVGFDLHTSPCGTGDKHIHCGKCHARAIVHE